jgi:ribonuclease-3
LYLDAGMEAARAWVLATLGPRITADSAHTPENPKSLLQEVVQARGATPVYRIADQQGPPHDRSFTAVVEVAGEAIGEGSGRSKREAEAAAAAAALEALGID